MPRMMSFSMTTPQFKRREKTVTRRLGWDHLENGEILWGVEKAMGLKKGDEVVRLGMIKVVNIRKEPLYEITQAECILEGFPDMTPDQFVDMFCEANRCTPDTIINRIEFGYLNDT